MKFQLIFKFWKKVLIRSAKSTLASLDFSGRFFNTLLTLLIVLIVASGVAIGLIQIQFLNSIVGSFRVQVTILLAVIVFFFLLFIINMIYIPAQMYDELHGFDELRLQYQFNCSQPRYSEAWASFVIYNDSPNPFRRCSVILEKAESLSDQSNPILRPEKLAWSSPHAPINEDKDIQPLESMTVDIARTDHQNNRILFTTQQSNELYRDKASRGEYFIQIRVKGIYGSRRHEEILKGRINYEGNRQLSCDGPE